MSLSVQNNISAMNAYRNLATTQNNLSSSLEKLSSGFRINRAADDAAGLAISEGLRSQVGGLTVAVRNAQDGISVVQTAEGALTETHAILQRMRDLSVQASNIGGLSQGAKENIQLEIGELKQELTRIADTTQFNGTNLLDGKYEGTFQIGANAGETISVNLKGAGLGAEGLNVSGVNVIGAAEGATGATVDHAVAGTAGTATTTGTDLATAAGFSDLSGTIVVGNKSFDLSTVDYSGATDATDVAELGTILTAAVEDAFGDSIASAEVTGGALVVTGVAPDAEASANEVAAASVAFQQATGASAAITTIDEAIAQVSTVRAELGAKQNRLDHTINSLQVSVENLTASESRIRDTDMANEMVAYTSANILQQAGTAMLAQANQLPQSVLSLLR